MKIHCIGIGGIGVSSLAQYYLSKGHEVSGSDLASSEITDFLAKKGVKIAIGNKPENIKKDVALVVYSPAVQKDNPEYKKAKDLGLKLMSYPEALGELTKEYYTIAITGSHGKSTTTAMTSLILEKAEIDPTVIIGTKLKEFNDSNFRAGKSNYLVIEACEYDGSFLHYFPKVIAVTNIDKEHLDYFKTFANVIKTFKNFIKNLPENGFLVSNKDDKNLLKISKGKFSTIYYGKRQEEFKKLKKILKLPGNHNTYNALAALTIARILNISDKISFKALSDYKGSWRRFEIFNKTLINPKTLDTRHYTLISDYGHHPNEIIATLSAAREKYPKNKIWLIFQPHQHKRTHYLFSDFIKTFRKASGFINYIIITDIYDVAGREEKKISSKISPENIVKEVKKKNVNHLSVDMAETFVKDCIKSGDILIIMGAGDIYKLVNKF